MLYTNGTCFDAGERLSAARSVAYEEWQRGSELRLWEQSR